MQIPSPSNLSLCTKLNQTPRRLTQDLESRFENNLSCIKLHIQSSITKYKMLRKVKQSFLLDP